MASLPVAINNNLNKNNTPVPIAGNTGAAGGLGGIKADGTSILVDQTTGVASASGAGAIAGTPNFIPKFATSSTLDDSSIDDGATTADVITVAKDTSIQAHASVGVGSSPVTPAFPTTNVLTVAETNTNAAEFCGVGCIVRYNPTVDTDGFGVDAIYAEIDANMDGQTNNAADILALEFHAIGLGNTIAMDTVTGCFGDADSTGNANLNNLVGMEVGPKYTGGGTCTNVIGVKIDSSNKGAGNVTNNIGLLVQTQNIGINNWAIQTQTGLVEFGDNVKCDKLIQAGTIYSAAGTALPSAATAGVGARAFVSDATSSTFAAAYAGGGSNKVPVYSDGTGWHIG